MDSLKLGPVFFGALEFPEYSWPNYFIINQRKSDWSRGIYLVTLGEIYHECIMLIQFKYNSTKRKSPGLTMDDVKIEIAQFAGKDNMEPIDKKTLDKLHKAVQAAWFVDVEQNKFSAIETLAFVECALAFMKKEFEYMAGKITVLGFRPRTNSYFNYLIAQNGPFFDFTKFKAAVREINLIHLNKTVFEATLEPFQKTAHEIVKLWNENIAPIVHNDSGKYTDTQPELVPVIFSSEIMTHGWADKEFVEIRPHKLWLCQDFAYYAAKISNLIMNEIFLPNQFLHRDDKKQFIPDLLSAIHLMQEEEIKVDLGNSGEIEDVYRNYIWMWFRTAGYQAERETLKGTGHIDLKIIHSSIGTKIMEFKGWWNNTKKEVVQQTIRYLTEFEDEGYVFIINTTGKSIIEKYCEIINNSNTGIIENIMEIQDETHKSYKYYRSLHEHEGYKKVIYHFIFSAIQNLKKESRPNHRKA